MEIRSIPLEETDTENRVHEVVMELFCEHASIFLPAKVVDFLLSVEIIPLI